MDKDEALKLALEALQWNWGGEPLPTLELQAINAIKEALAQPGFVLNGIDCSCGRKWRVVNNTLTASEQPEQEPEAWQVKYRDDEGIPQIAWFPHPVHSKSPLAKLPYTEEPLYTTPPQRKWVGLTDEERDHFEGLHLYAARNQVEAWIEGVPAFIDAIEAKLREKNGE